MNLTEIPTRDLVDELRDRMAVMTTTQRKFWMEEVRDGYCEKCGRPKQDCYQCA